MQRIPERKTTHKALRRSTYVVTEGPFHAKSINMKLMKFGKEEQHAEENTPLKQAATIFAVDAFPITVSLYIHMTV